MVVDDIKTVLIYREKYQEILIPKWENIEGDSSSIKVQLTEHPMQK